MTMTYRLQEDIGTGYPTTSTTSTTAPAPAPSTTTSTGSPSSLGGSTTTSLGGSAAIGQAPAPAPSTGLSGSGMINTSLSGNSPAAGAGAPASPFGVELVQRRIGDMLRTDERGGYLDPVVRQAVDRQNQQFNARGLLNSSMAAQAGQEAAISKATEIAAADASAINAAAEAERQRQFQAEQHLGDQDFQMRSDYQSSVREVQSNYQRMIDTINASQMTPPDKSVAIAQATSVRDGELVYQNNLFSNMPRWKSEWMTMAVPTAGVDLNSITNNDTLANIANDPAQTQAERDAARARMGQAGTGGGGTTPGSTGAIPSSWYNPIPATIGAPPGSTLAGLYQQYQTGGGTLSPDAWYQQRYSNYGGGQG